MSSLVSKEHLAKASALRMQMAIYSRSEDLIRIGAYQNGTDPHLDTAIRNLPAIEEFLTQKPDDLPSLQKTIEMLMSLPA